MAVLLSTSAGELVIDLYTEECPVACENFVKLCKMKYYHQCLFYNLQTDYIIQCGDPTGTGKGGSSVFEILDKQIKKEDSNSKNTKRYFVDEINLTKKLNKIGYVGYAHGIANQQNTNQSQFFITLRDEDMDHIAKTHTIFGEVAEGVDVLAKLNQLYCDEDGRPYQDVRVLHTYILDDPFPDPRGLDVLVPPESPSRERPIDERVKTRIPYTENVLENEEENNKNSEELEESIRRKEAKSRAIVLEMVGDIPDADVKPPDEVLFVCKLNPVTTDADLELIFSQFGAVRSCEIIRDHKTGDSLNYAFIEYETQESCVRAYEKMNNALIDDRRIKVDFSQSVAKLWNRFLMKPRKPNPIPGRKPAAGAETGSKQDMGIYGENYKKPATIESKIDDRKPRDSRDDRDRKDSRREHDQRDRSRDRGRDDRHGQRDRDRHSDRDRDRDRDRGSDRRDYDRKRDEDRDQKKDRHYHDDRENEKKRRDRDRSRSRSRDKGRDRDRDRKKSSR